MRFSIMAGWFYSVMRMVGGEGKSNTKWYTNRGVARDLDGAESNSQTLAPACRSSQNAVKMPVDIGVLISSRLNWVLRTWQNLLRLVAFALLSCIALAHSDVALAESIPACEIKDANGQKISECTDPIDIQYSMARLDPEDPPASLPRFVTGKTAGEVGDTISAYFSQYSIAQYNKQVAMGLNPDSYGEYRRSSTCPYSQFGLILGPPAHLLGGNDGFPFVDYSLGINSDCNIEARIIYSDGRSPSSWQGFVGGPYISILCPEGSNLFPGSSTLDGRGGPPFKCLRSIEKPCPDKCITDFGNPISARTNVKKQIETSLNIIPSLSRFVELQYSYPSSVPNANVGAYWQPRYLRSIRVKEAQETGVTAPRVIVSRNSEVTIFQNVAGSWKPDADMSDRLTELKNAQGVRTGWKYYDASNEDTETYDIAGRLTSIRSRAGATQTLSYNAGGQLISVTDDFGHLVSFTYYPADATLGANNIATVSGGAGNTVTYSYDAFRNLASVTYPDGKTKTYLYGNLADAADYRFRNALTGIKDENGTQFATFKYDSYGVPTSTEHVGGANKFQFSFGGTYPFSSSSVTDPLGTAKTYIFQTILGNQRLTSLSQPCTTPGCTGDVTQSRTYDANGNIATLKDFNGTTTSYQYDLARNLELSRTEGIPATLTGSCPNGGVYYADNYTSSCGSGTCWATSGSFPGSQDATFLGYPGWQYACAVPPANSSIRKITTTWHASYRLPATITEPITGGSKTTTNTYDANGNLTQRVVTTPQATRTWLWSGYDAYGRATTMTDPRGKITTHTYYPNTAAQNTTLANSRGMLASITNAVGHVNTITAYNAHGQPLAMTDANGLVTSMTYDARMRLKSRTVSGSGINETTAYDYDGVGQLIKVTLPDASFITYTYDGAHRLTQIQDSQANKIVYTLDAMGNRTAEQAFDPAGALARSRTRVYDALNRLKQDIGATTPATQISQYGYDNQGNATSTTDPLSRVTTNAFDALNRLVQVTDPNTPTAGITKYDYDVQDNLTKVTDAKFSPQGAAAPATTYTYNGFNELISQSSPDTGLTSYTYDAAGNMLSKTDARDKVAKYVYDNINRVTQIKYFPTTANANANTSADETVTYTYDTGCGNATNSKGRLCKLADKSGTTTYSYDLLGRTTAKSQAVASLTQTHSYRYNAAGQMDQLTTASGQVIGYGYSNNRVTSISVNGAALLGSITYDPFGPAVAWLWPSAATPALKTYRDYDLDGRMTRWELKNGVSYIQRDVLWDNASRVINLKDLLTPAQANNQGFGYDALDRLTTTNLGTATTAAQILAYDAIGNRTSATINGIISTYNTGTTSHRLNSTTGGANPRTFTYDAMGNLTFDGKYTYTHWSNGRINTVTWVTGTAPNTTTNTATYNINALGQRVRKLAPSNVGGTRRFMYDEAGRIAGEYDASGKLVQETIWLGDLPIATLRPKSGSTTTPIQIDVFYVHADHLGTPRVITRPSDNKIVWKWDSTEAFGNNLPNENPSALGNFKYNLRMPGQYFDQETGTFYNYFRDYDPSLGRYVQSDPIGLRGGINTFAYVNGNPVTLIDPQGLKPIACPAGLPAGTTCDDGLGNENVRSRCVTAECGAGIPPARPITCMEKCMLEKFGLMGLSSVGRNGSFSMAQRYGGVAVATFAGAARSIWTPAAAAIGLPYVGFLADQCQQKCGLQCEAPPTTTFFFAP
jgi:RHS repeat-associated protein